jgi:formamidopyrimidine-DNA glycosylase
MPECSEVKLITEGIARLAAGRVLRSVTVVNSGFLKKTKALHMIPLPQLVTSVQCKGKFGYMCLADGSAVGFMFGMSGNIRIEPDAEYLAMRKETHEQYMKHCKVRFVMESTDTDTDTGTGTGTGTGTTRQNIFYFYCIRNFEWVCYYTPDELAKKLSEIGPSIMGDLISPQQLALRWRKAGNKAICQTVMDQKYISGIGNYIKAETLYRSRVHPLAMVASLSDEHLWTIYMSARDVAEMAYGAGGGTLYTFTGIDGRRIDFRSLLAVYDKSIDPLGYLVHQMDTPDKRNTHWVPEVQTIGAPLQDPPPPPSPPITRIKVKVRARVKAPET